MAIILALAAAGLIGTGDFLGGFASRRHEAGSVVTVVYSVGVPTLLVVAPLLGGSPAAADFAWGAGSGVAGAIGLRWLYRGFARSRMAIVSPLAAVLGAAIPVVVGVATGDTPGRAGAGGLVLGLIAVVLVTRSPEGGQHGSIATGVIHGVGAGIAFASFFIMLSFTADGAGLWPVLPSRLVGTVVLLAVIRRPPRVTRTTVPAVVVGGVFSVLGSGAFLLATQEGELSVVTVLTSLYPAVTVLWARLVFTERLAVSQALGVACALMAVGLLSL